jgi:Tol biopolymer transport system component
MPADTSWARLSPDDSRIATDPADTSGRAHDVWLLDLARGAATRFTFGPLFSGYPLWSPDGSRIAFYSNGAGIGNPYLKNSNGVGAEELVYARKVGNHRIEDWSRDGRFLIEGVIDTKTQNDIWIIPQFGDKKPFPYLNSEYREDGARLSPNGQFLAYESDESKREEVYVQTFPEHGGKWQISTAGGHFAVWSRDGRELYFLGEDRKIMAVEVKGEGKNFQAGVPKPLFNTTINDPFDVSKDGRFLLQVPLEQASANIPLTVVTNWQSALKK